MEKPSYYSVLPASVRYNEQLSDSEKLLFSEITALANKNGECWASNSYFANLFNVSASTISRRLSNLKKLGFIDIELQMKKGSKEIEKRIVKIDTTYTQNCVGGIRKYAHRGIRKIAQENNTSNEYYKNNNITPIVPLKGDSVDPFEIFWKSYPKKVGKGQAKKTFKKVVKDKETFDLILNDLSKRKTFEGWTKDNGRFIPYPSTYLNQERWLDEYDIQPKSKNRFTNMYFEMEED